MQPAYIIAQQETAIGSIPVVTTTLKKGDRIDALKCRLGIGRHASFVTPGIYAVGAPTPEAPVFLSANYKLSFDALRSQLTGLDAWIVVLDTKGINVWCAAGKGTFGTDEIVSRVKSTRLSELVTHRKLIVPQLGAPGVSAHEVRERSGFSVIYGPILAKDIPAFLDAGMKATPEMRRKRFPLRERIVLVPMEVRVGLKYALIAAFAFFIISGFGTGGFLPERVAHEGVLSALLLIAAFFAGAICIPIALPWIPIRSFAGKGALVGAVMVGALLWSATTHPGIFSSKLVTASWILIIPAITSFTAMNFTGASTYTSPSGVSREMRFALPAQILCAAVGSALWIAARFFL